MKKIIVLLVALLTLSLVTVPVFAENGDTSSSIDVTISITDNKDGTFKVVVPNDPNYAVLTPRIVVNNTGLTEASVYNETASAYLPAKDVSVDKDGNVSFVARSGGTYIISAPITATVTVAPAANVLTYTGSAQALVTAGECTNGIMMYSMSTNGEFSETIPTQTAVGTYTVYYYAKGVDAKDSNVSSVEVLIGKKEFDGKIPTPTVESSITYGQSIGEAGLKGEGWEFANASFVPKNAGTYNATVMYTLSDTDSVDYSKVDGYNVANNKLVRSISITVNKANPTNVEFPSLTAKYGDKFKDVILPEGFAFADSVDTDATVGNASSTPVDVSVVYTPEDSANYNTVTGVAKLTVGKADPESVTFPELTATYGDTLANVELPEGFAFVETDLNKTVGNASDTPVNVAVVYTPKDSNNYNSVTGNATLTVNKADYTGTVVVPSLDPVASGTKLADVKLPAGYEWKDTTTEVEKTAVAIYTPDTNHNGVEVTIPLNIISTGVDSKNSDVTASVDNNDPLTSAATSVIKGENSIKSDMTTETKAELAEAISNSANINTYVEVKVSEANVEQEELTAIENKAGADSEIVTCVDIDVMMTIETDSKKYSNIKLTELSSPLTITIKLPKGAPTKSSDSNKILQYFIVLEHEGQLSTIPATLNDDGTISFSSRLFSTYAIAYKLIDKPAPSSPSYGGYVFPKTGVDR